MDGRALVAMSVTTAFCSFSASTACGISHCAECNRPPFKNPAVLSALKSKTAADKVQCTKCEDGSSLTHGRCLSLAGKPRSVEIQKNNYLKILLLLYLFSTSRHTLDSPLKFKHIDVLQWSSFLKRLSYLADCLKLLPYCYDV